jgi:hypothetical protein
MQVSSVLILSYVRFKVLFVRVCRNANVVVASGQWCSWAARFVRNSYSSDRASAGNILGHSNSFEAV